MGCIWSKGTEEEETVDALKQEAHESLQHLSTSSKKEIVALSNKATAANARAEGKRPQNVVAPLPEQFDVRGNVKNHQLKTTDGEGNTGVISGSFDVPNGFSGEQMVAGWPEWLTNVAPEAVKGWLPRRADSFERLNKIGQGTYSNVYKARDLETGRVVALKKVRFVNMDPESVLFMAREINILRRLDHPNIVKLEGIVTSSVSCNLYLVFEYMDHDLAGLAATPGIKFTEPQIKCYMQQLLSGLEHCHNHGVLHRDIKGSNLLIDNNGILKIADFGLATFFNAEQKQDLTSRVVTLWYRPPELLLGNTEYGVSVDLWSSGCILAELLTGKPIMPGRTEVEQIHKIFKLCGSPPEEYWELPKLPHAIIFKPLRPYPRLIRETFKDCSPSTLALLDTLLSIQPKDRGTATSAVQSDFLTAEPLPCDPSSLPKYPPSKAYDAKLRDEKARRQKVAVCSDKPGKRASADHKTMPGLDANGGLQKRGKGQLNPQSASKKNSHIEEGGSGFPIDTLGAAQHSLPKSHSTMHPSAIGSSWNKKDESRMTNHPCTTVWVQNGSKLNSNKSYYPQSGLEFANTRSSMSSRHTGRRHHVVELNEKQHALSRVSSIQKQDMMTRAEGYGSKGRRIQYSGPLGGNMQELLKEHERQIQLAFRKARLEKVKTKKHFYCEPASLKLIPWFHSLWI